MMLPRIHAGDPPASNTASLLFDIGKFIIKNTGGSAHVSASFEPLINDTGDTFTGTAKAFATTDASLIHINTALAETVWQGTLTPQSTSGEKFVKVTVQMALSGSLESSGSFIAGGVATVRYDLNVDGRNKTFSDSLLNLVLTGSAKTVNPQFADFSFYAKVGEPFIFQGGLRAFAESDAILGLASAQSDFAHTAQFTIHVASIPEPSYIAIACSSCLLLFALYRKTVNARRVPLT